MIFPQENYINNGNKPAEEHSTKMRGHKLVSGVNWYTAFKQEGVKQTGIKQGCGVY